MEKGNTKQRILEEALDLFSTQGFEATSVLQIADAVGIRKASLYSHFASKQDILDTLLNEILKEYEKHSIFTSHNLICTKNMDDITPKNLIRTIQNQVRYVLHDPKICKGRKMLTITQYQNSKMAAIQTKQNYTDVLAYFEEFVRLLVRNGKLREFDTGIMASHLCLPITVWLGLCDREPEREDEVMALIERHVKQFFMLYGEGENK